MAPGLKQRVLLPGPEGNLGGSTSPVGFLRHSAEFGAFPLLLNKPATLLDMEAIVPPNLRRATASSPIEKLPAELFLAILGDCALGPADILAIALCSQSLWVQTACYIHSIRATSRSSWVDTPIACVGSYLRTLPTAFGELLPEVLESSRTFNGLGTHPVRPWQFKASSSFRNLTKFDLDRCWLGLFDVKTRCAKIPKAITRELRSRLRDHILKMQSISLEGSGRWILRNLTKKEAVHLICSAPVECAAVRKQLTVCVAGASPELSMDKALMLKICWTLQGDPYSRGAAELKQGGWAGDSFEVVPAQIDDLGEGWTDVTKELLNTWKVVSKTVQDRYT